MKFIFVLRFEQIFLIPSGMECSSVRPVVINDWPNISVHLSGCHVDRTQPQKPHQITAYVHPNLTEIQGSSISNFKKS